MGRLETVLAVDDNPTNLAIIEELLEDGYDLITAESGEAALELARERQPSIVLLDIMMPGIDGYETCRRIRQDPAFGDPKIIMVSAKAMVSERLAGYEAGADDYLTKPFDHAEFLAKVEVYARLRRVEEVDSLKGEVLQMLSHNTNTPLNGLMAPLELLMSPGSLSFEELQELASIAHDSASRLHRLFRNVVTLSALKSGDWKPQMRPIDLAELVAQAASKAARTNPSRGQPNVSGIPEEAVVNVDAEGAVFAMTTALDTLLKTSEADAEIEVRVSRDGDNWTASFSCPSSLDSKDRRALFEPFATAVTDVAGIAELALPVAKSIMEAHGGAMSVQDGPRRETTFSISFPVLVAVPG